MQPEFYVDLEADSALLAKVASLTPDNPFYTEAYVETMRALGSQVVVLCLWQNDELLSACPALVRSGRLSKTLEITSLPALSDPAVFWEGLREFCRKSGVTILEVNTYASTVAQIHNFEYETGRIERVEYVIDLQSSDLWKQTRKGHRYNITRGRKAGLQVRRTIDSSACLEHINMMGASLERRRAHGESVLEDLPLATSRALLEHKAGELFQAVRDGQVLASALILKAAKGAYYQTAGTCEAGRECGASTFLVFEIAKALQDQGYQSFNLGGTEVGNRGLQDFKTGFGAAPVPLAAANFFLGGSVKKKLFTTLRLLRHDRRGLLRHLLGRVERYVVYSTDPRAIQASDIEGAVLKKLSDEELASLPVDQDFLKEQVERLSRLGFNDAYGVYYKDQLAHISWLITSEHDRVIKPRNVKLKAGEAEITNCVTLPEFRGLGLYAFAIRSLCEVAAGAGAKRVFMITNVNNLASQRGMQKAGLSSHGKILRVAFSYLPNEAGFTYRGHRWGTRANNIS
jgi:ribosomal protein S18 acetylase RimI-like enzyme